MNQAHSSIFSSSPPEKTRTKYASLAWLLLGFFLALLAFEVAIAAFLAMQKDYIPAGSSIARYLNYGISTQEKLDLAVGIDGQEAKPLIRAGWISTELYQPSKNWTDKDTRIVFYGSSFTNRIARKINNIDPEIGTLTRAGPGAPLNHSYALFSADPYREKASHIVVGLLSSSIPYMQGFTGLGYSFENPAPYTYPQYSMTDGKFKKRILPINDRDEFISSYRKNSPKWKAHLEQIKAHDPFWNTFTFNKSWMDQSAIIRFLRRYWSSRIIRLTKANIFTPKDGYNLNNSSIEAIPEIFSRMKTASNATGQKLIVVLLHSSGEPGHLDNWLGDKLRTIGITVISSTDLFSSTDFSNFESDGHYLPQHDKELAISVIKSLRR